MSDAFVSSYEISSNDVLMFKKYVCACVLSSLLDGYI